MIHLKSAIISHKRLNHLLALIVGTLALYIVVWPIAPQVGWWLRHSAPIISRPAVNTGLKLPAIPKENTLIIPKIDIKQSIIEGTDLSTLDKGIWRRPLSSNPSLGGNTVLAGHRFGYTGKGPFYFLDKLTIGDKITVYWEGVRYEYEVNSIKEVPPSDISVEQPSSGAILTMYTCAPLWTAKNRLIIQAKLVETNQ